MVTKMETSMLDQSTTSTVIPIPTPATTTTSKAMAIFWLLNLEGEESDEIVKFVLDRHGHPREATEEE